MIKSNPDVSPGKKHQQDKYGEIKKPTDLFVSADKYEPLLFWILVLVGTLPLLLNKYYQTLDGPSHLYNGNIIKELVLGNYSEFRNLFCFNPLLVPNWISHFLFAVLGLVFPDFITEKIVFLGYFILTPLFFRKICLNFSPENKFLSYLMIPFAHNHLFYFGFFNFSIAITLFLATVYFGLKIQNNFQTKHIWILALLLLIIYFSHIMVLMISIFVLFLLPLTVLTLDKNNVGYEIKGRSEFTKNIRFTAWSTIPAVLLAANYIFSVDSLEQAPRMDLMPLLKMVVDIRPLMPLAYGFPWKIYNWILAIFFLVLIIGNIAYWIRRNFKKNTDGFTFSLPTPRFSLIWFLIAFAFVTLFLIVPNSNLLPERLILIFYLFFILGISTLSYPRILRILSLVFILTIQIVYVKLHLREMGDLSNQVEKIRETTKQIEPGSLLLTLNYSDNWFNSHISGYFGSDKPIAVVDNYEGSLSWFPVCWNVTGPYKLDRINTWGADNKKMTKSFYVNSPDTTVFSLVTKNNGLVKIQYVVKMGNSIDMSKDYSVKTEEVLASGYKLTFQNDFCKLYELKN